MSKINIFFLSFFVLFFSCRPDPEVTDKGNLKINFYFQVNGSDIEYGFNNPCVFDPYNNWSIQLENLKIYFSNLKATNIDENSIQNILEVCLVDFTDPYSLSFNIEMAPGSYNDFTIGFGLDSILNSTNPITVLPANPLSSNSNMFWSAWPTYIFMKLDGTMDTSGDGVFNNNNFSYHPGASKLYNTKTSNNTFEILPSLETQIDIVININNIFYPTESGLSSIDISSEPGTHTFIDAVGTVDPLAVTFFENVISATTINY